MVRQSPRVRRSVKFSRQENKALELEALRLGTDVNSLLRAELFPMLRRIRKRHADKVSHLPHGP